MKVTYEFSEDFQNERKIFECARDFFTDLWDISTVIRDWRKYEKTTPEKTLEAIADILSQSKMNEIE